MTRTTCRWAIAAGIVGVLANGLLIAFYALEIGRGPVLGTVSLGSLNDLVGSLSTALMMPVVLAIGPRWLRAAVAVLISALTAAGPLLVAGAITFETQALIAIPATAGLALWMVRVGKYVPGLPPGLRRLAKWTATALLSGMAVAGAALLLPWMSWPQLVLFGLGGAAAAGAWLAIPVWFVWLGRSGRVAVTV